MLEHLEAIGRGITQFSPTAAAVLAALDTYINHDRAKFRKKVNETIVQRLELCEHRLDAEAIKRDGFAEIFAAVDETIRTTEHEVKVQAAINIFENALLADGEAGKISYSELEFFARSVNELSSGAIYMLGSVIGVEQRRNQRPLEQLDLNSVADDRFSRDFKIGLLRELEQRHFVLLEFTNMHFEGKRDASMRSTDLGRRFCKDILQYEASES